MKDNKKLASFPGSPSFRAIIPRMTFDPPLFLRAGQRSNVELLRGRRVSLGTRLIKNGVEHVQVRIRNI